MVRSTMCSCVSNKCMAALTGVFMVIVVCGFQRGNGQPSTNATTVPPLVSSESGSGAGSTSTLCNAITEEFEICMALGGRMSMYQYEQFIPQLEGRSLVGNTIQIAFNLIESGFSPPPPPICKDLLQHLLCYAAAPPCDPTTDLVLPICNDSCRAYEMLLDSNVCLEFNNNLQEFAASSNVVEVQVIFGLYAIFDCANGSTYNFREGERGELAPETCTSMFSPSNEETTEVPTIVTTDRGTNIGAGVIAGAVVAVLVLITLVLIIVAFAIGCCVFRKRMKEPWAEMELKDESRMGNVVVSTAVRYSLPNRDVEDSDTVVMTESDKKQHKALFSSVLVPYVKMKIGDCVGEGAFGKVYKGEMQTLSDQQTSDIAVKTIKNLSSQNELKAFFSESLIMKDFNHPNVLGLVGVCFDTPDDVPYIILPFMVNGSLKDYLKKQRVHESNVDTYPENLQLVMLVEMCIDIANGMDYLAEKKFVHRDLAARNCMVSETLAIKVGDFGLARDVYSSDYYRANTKAKVPVKWMPPETLHDGISNEKTDVWSFGVTCWEVFSLGRTPYPGVQNHDMIKFISSGGRLERPTLCPEKVYHLFVMCWEAKSEDRPTFSKLVGLLEDYYDKELSYVNSLN